MLFPPLDEHHREGLLEAALDASQRTRTALYAMVVFCVFALAIFANQFRPTSFFYIRYQTLRAASSLYSCPTVPRWLLSDQSDAEKSARQIAPEAELIARYSRVYRTKAEAIPVDEREEEILNRVYSGGMREWLKACPGYGAPAGDGATRRRALSQIFATQLSQAEVTSLLAGSRDARIENVLTITVPIADIKMDANAAGLMLGLGHLVLLLWLYVSSKQEVLVIDKVCQKVRDGYALIRYRSFFVPSTLDATPRFSMALRVAVVASVFVPLLLTCSFVGYDLYTLTEAQIVEVYPMKVLIEYLLGETLLVAAGLYSCVKIARLYALLTSDSQFSHVPWSEWGLVRRLEWLLRQASLSSSDDERQVHGRTIADILWLHYGVTDTDVGGCLERVLVNDTACDEPLSALARAELNALHLDWLIDRDGKLRRVLCWSAQPADARQLPQDQRRLGFDRARVAGEAGWQRSMAAWRDMVQGDRLRQRVRWRRWLRGFRPVSWMPARWFEAWIRRIERKNEAEVRSLRSWGVVEGSPSRGSA